MKRRLTCILAADAVGYSGQMAEDEEGTVRVLAAHRAVIDGIITIAARFEASRGSGRRLELRACDLRFVKQ